MANKNPRQRRRRRRSGPAATSVESRSADAATVAWMLCLMATVLAELVGLATRLLFVFWDASELMRVFASIMLFVALIAGAATLVLTPIVLRLREQSPPQSIVRFALVAAILPMVAVAAQQLALRSG